MCRLQVEAHRIKLVLTAAGIRAGELHGNLNQAQRLQSLQGFKDGVVDVLVCTDVAARGLDITGVQCVINTEMPRNRYGRLGGQGHPWLVLLTKSQYHISRLCNSCHP